MLIAIDPADRPRTTAFQVKITRNWVWPPLLALACFCTSDVAAQRPGLRVIEHPREDFRVKDAATIAAHEPNVPSQAVQQYLARLRNRAVLFDIPSSSMEHPGFTSITSASLQGQQLILLDAQSPLLAVFDMKGNPLAMTRGGVRADPKLSHPRAIAVVNDTVLFVADLNLQVTEWRLRDSSIEFHGFHSSFNGEPKDLCAIQDDLFLHALPFEDSTTIYRPKKDGDRTSFGVVYRSQSERVNWAAREGRLTCVPRLNNDSSLVVWGAFALLGELRGYSPTGASRWIVRLPVEPPQFSEVGSGSRTIIPPSGFHRLESLISVEADFVLAQFAKLTPDSYQAANPIVSLDTYIVDLRNLQVAKVPFALPQVLAASRNHLVLKRTGTLPSITVFSY